MSYFTDKLLSAFTQTWEGIRKHKFLFVLLIILQFVILGLFTYIVLIHQLKVITTLQSLLEPLQQANYDPQLVDAGQPFLKDIKAIYDSYKTLMQTLASFIVWSALLFLFPQSGLWIGSHYLLEEKKSWKELLKQKFSRWCKYVCSSIVGVIPIIIVLYILGKLALAQGDSAPLALYGQITLLVMAICYYFLIIAFAALPLSSWGLFLVRIKTLFWKKIQYTLPLFVANIVLISILVYLIYRTLNMEEFFTIMLLLSILLIILLVLLRVFWISFTQKITEHE